MPPAPGLFSMTTCCPSDLLNSAASRRAATSVAPPGGYPTMTLTGREGQSCAWAGTVPGNPPAASARAIRMDRRCMRGSDRKDGGSLSKRWLTSSSTYSSDSTSQNFISRSNRLARCACGLRSPQASSTTMVRKLCENASAAPARTQPEVEMPQTTTVSTRSYRRNDSRGVWKKHDGLFFRMIRSMGRGA